MSRRNCNARGRRNVGHFSMWLHACHDAERYTALSLPARALLVEFLGQYRGNNNGDLTCAYAVLGLRGWKARSTIERAAKELEHYGWIIRTRQGGRNMPNLYAVTWQPIDECGGKLDVPPGLSPGTWKQPIQVPWRVAKKQFDLQRRKATLQRRKANRGVPLAAEEGNLVAEEG